MYSLEQSYKKRTATQMTVEIISKSRDSFCSDQWTKDEFENGTAKSDPERGFLRIWILETLFKCCSVCWANTGLQKRMQNITENQGDQKWKSLLSSEGAWRPAARSSVVHGGARDAGAGTRRAGRQQVNWAQDLRLPGHCEQGWPRPHWFEKPMRPVTITAPVNERAQREHCKIHICFVQCILSVAINPNPQDIMLRSNFDRQFAIWQHTKMQYRCIICFISQHYVSRYQFGCCGFACQPGLEQGHETCKEQPCVSC